MFPSMLTPPGLMPLAEGSTFLLSRTSLLALPCRIAILLWWSKIPSVVPTIARIRSHLTADLTECSAFRIHLLFELTEAIIEALARTKDVWWYRQPDIFVHILNILCIVHSVAEPAVPLRHFSFCLLDHRVDKL